MTLGSRLVAFRTPIIAVVCIGVLTLVPLWAALSDRPNDIMLRSELILADPAIMLVTDQLCISNRTAESYRDDTVLVVYSVDRGVALFEVPRNGMVRDGQCVFAVQGPISAADSYMFSLTGSRKFTFAHSEIVTPNPLGETELAVQLIWD